jgi:hypothetical protein
VDGWHTAVGFVKNFPIGNLNIEPAAGVEAPQAEDTRRKMAVSATERLKQQRQQNSPPFGPFAHEGHGPAPADARSAGGDPRDIPSSGREGEKVRAGGELRKLPLLFPRGAAPVFFRPINAGPGRAAGDGISPPA